MVNTNPLGTLYNPLLPRASADLPVPCCPVRRLSIHGNWARGSAGGRASLGTRLSHFKSWQWPSSLCVGHEGKVDLFMTREIILLYLEKGMVSTGARKQGTWLCRQLGFWVQDKHGAYVPSGDRKEQNQHLVLREKFIWALKLFSASLGRNVLVFWEVSCSLG